MDDPDYLTLIVLFLPAPGYIARRCSYRFENESDARDLLSLCLLSYFFFRQDGGGAAGEEEKAEAAAFVVGELPADVLLLRGTAVVDESSLTGESVPQIKTSLTSEPIDFEDDLDMTGVRDS